MGIVGGTDADDVDFRIVYNIMPIGAPFFVTKSLAGIFRNFGIDVAEGFQYRICRSRPEKLRHIGVSNGVGFAHETSAYQSNI